jgi:hypothetical protein
MDLVMADSVGNAPQGRRWVALTAGIALLVIAVFVAAKSGSCAPQPSVSASGHTHTNSSGAGEGADDQSRPTALSQADASASAAESDASRRRGQGEVLARAEWGRDAGQVGRTRPDEANPEAPMAFVVQPDGTVIVLDQVNRRLQRFARDGSLLAPIALSLRAPQDLVLGPNGSLVVTDRLLDERVAVLDADGRERGRIPIVGSGIEHAGNVTSTIVDRDEILLERQHTRLVRAGRTDGTPLVGDAGARDTVPGRPTRDGTAFLRAGITETEAGRVYVTRLARPSEDHVYTRELRVPMQAVQILLLDSDRAGTIYLAVAGPDRTPVGQDAAIDAPHRLVLVCLEGSRGAVLGQVAIRANQGAEETFREFFVPDEGGAVYAARSERGVEYQRYDCRP